MLERILLLAALPANPMLKTCEQTLCLKPVSKPYAQDLRANLCSKPANEPYAQNL